MQQDLIRILTTLICLRTTADNTQEVQKCFEYIKQELVDLPFTIEEITRNNHLSVIWRSAPTLNNHKKILLNAHLDVVPASDSMFTLRRDGDKLIGRGVTDMKFGIACFIVALKQIYTETKTLPPVDIIITSDEEIGGHDGAGYLAKTLPSLTDTYRLVFIPDGGDDWHIIEETKGAPSSAQPLLARPPMDQDLGKGKALLIVCLTRSPHYAASFQRTTSTAVA